MGLNEDLDLPADLRRDLMACAVAKGIDYHWLCGIYRRGLSVKIGATGQFPYGSLGQGDEGELAVAIAADREHHVIRFEFGKPVAWLALAPSHARTLAAALVAKADELDKALS